MLKSVCNISGGSYPNQYTSTWQNVSNLLTKVPGVGKFELQGFIENLRQHVDIIQGFRLEFTIPIDYSIAEDPVRFFQVNDEQMKHVFISALMTSYGNGSNSSDLLMYHSPETGTKRVSLYIPFSINLAMKALHKQRVSVRIGFKTNVSLVHLYTNGICASSVERKKLLTLHTAVWPFTQKVRKIEKRNTVQFEKSAPWIKGILLYIPLEVDRAHLAGINFKIFNNYLSIFPAHFCNDVFPRDAGLTPQDGLYYLPLDEKLNREYIDPKCQIFTPETEQCFLANRVDSTIELETHDGHIVSKWFYKDVPCAAHKIPFNWIEG